MRWDADRRMENVYEFGRFEHNEMSLADSVNAIWTDLLLLMVLNVLFFMAAYLIFLRYDVR